MNTGDIYTFCTTKDEALDVLEDCILNTKGYNLTGQELALELWEQLKDNFKCGVC